jgi:aryl-alcohol dehydrogenase-like predicted oxidoreductase
MVDALERSGAAIVASASLAGGVLSGKYELAGAAGRMSERIGHEDLRHAREAASQLGDLAQRLGCTSAALAFAFALSRPGVATVLFGATAPDQIDANLEALGLLASLSAPELAELEAIGSSPELPTTN